MGSATARWGMADPPRRAAGGRAPGWAAFLRGINVGGKHKLPMRELTAFFAELGARDVRTYIQSGNVVFRATPDVIAGLRESWPSRAAARYGFEVPPVLRSYEELREVVRANPFPHGDVDERTLHVMFLGDTPAPEAVARIDVGRSPPDAFAVRGREIYLHLPDGMARTRLTNAYLEAILATTSTARNWRTVQAVLALAGA